MITGDINHLEDYKNQLPESIYVCLKALREIPFAQLNDGKYVVWHTTVSLESPVTAPAEKRKLEGHKKFIDVVYDIEGEEWIGCCPKWDGGEEIEADETRDLYFYLTCEEETKVYMKTGRFMVCYPEDLHRPLCCGISGPQRIRKVVLKFPISERRSKWEI